jgi:hypothetical protein
MRILRNFFWVGIPRQNPSGTLAFADHERSEVGGKPTISEIVRL